MNWRTARTIILDTETTGVDPETDRVIQLGGYSFSGGDLDTGERLGVMVNPGVPIPATASAVHGFTDADVADQPSFHSVAWRLIERVSAAEVLGGYNWPFDCAMLTRELERDGLAREEQGDPEAWRHFEAWEKAVAEKPVLDPLVIVRLDNVGRYWSGKGRHTLDAVAIRLGVKRRGMSHRASSDAEVAARVLHRLGEYIPEDANEATRFLAAERERQDQAFQAWLAAQPAQQQEAS